MVVTWSYSGATNTATASGAGSTNFAALVAADTAGGWGVYSSDSTGTQIICTGKIIIGDGSNATTMTDYDKQIIIAINTTDDSVLVQIKNKSSLTFGRSIDATAKTSAQGCSLIYTGTTVRPRLTSDSGSKVYFYSSHFACDETLPSGTNSFSFYLLGSGSVMWNCLLSNDIPIVTPTGLDLYNVTTEAYGATASAVNYPSPDNAVFEGLVATGWSIVCAASYICVFKDCTFKGITTLLSTATTSNRSYYFVNCVSNAWTFNWYAYHASMKAYRQYTFDLAVADSAGTAISSATVTLKDNTGTNVFSVSTDASGLITQQTVSRGYYNQANGNTLQDYGPFTLTVSKTGYITYPKAGIVLDKKMDWSISLHAQLSGDAAVGDVASGKKFYKDDADTQLTGTYTAPTLTGNAGVGDVASGKTFYKDDAANKLTGTLALTGNATINDVAKGKTLYNDSLTTKLTGALIHPTGGVGFIVGDKSPAKILAEKEAEIIEPSLMLNGILLIHNRRLKQINARLQKENFAK